MGSFELSIAAPGRSLKPVMESAINYNELNDLLRLCGATRDAAQAHGLLSARLAVTGADDGGVGIGQVLEEIGFGTMHRPQCEDVLAALFRETHIRLSDRQSEFEPLLPGDDDDTAVRAAALANWCEGFLHGLVSAAAGGDLQQRLASEPIAGIIRDMLQITRAAADGGSDTEEDEAAYIELVEYLRVAVQLVYEDLADLRSRHRLHGLQGDPDPELLH